MTAARVLQLSVTLDRVCYAQQDVCVQQGVCVITMNQCDSMLSWQSSQGIVLMSLVLALLHIVVLC